MLSRLTANKIFIIEPQSLTPEEQKQFEMNEELRLAIQKAKEEQVGLL